MHALSAIRFRRAMQHFNRIDFALTSDKPASKFVSWFLDTVGPLSLCPPCLSSTLSSSLHLLHTHLHGHMQVHVHPIMMSLALYLTAFLPLLKKVHVLRTVHLKKHTFFIKYTLKRADVFAPSSLSMQLNVSSDISFRRLASFYMYLVVIICQFLFFLCWNCPTGSLSSTDLLKWSGFSPIHKPSRSFSASCSCLFYLSLLLLRWVYFFSSLSHSLSLFQNRLA